MKKRINFNVKKMLQNITKHFTLGKINILVRYL